MIHYIPLIYRYSVALANNRARFCNKSKPKTEQTGHCRLPELSNFGSPPAEPGVYHD